MSVVKIARYIAEYGLVDVSKIHTDDVIEKDILNSAILSAGKGIPVLLQKVETLDALNRIENETTPTKDEINSIIQVLIDESERKQLAENLIKLVNNINNGNNEDYVNAMAYIEKMLSKVKTYNDDGDIIRLLEDDINLETERSDGYTTGTIVDTWNKLIPGELGIVIAPPAVGKTSLLVDIASGFLEHNRNCKVLHFSGEMGINQVYRKYSHRLFDGDPDWKNSGYDLTIYCSAPKKTTVNKLSKFIERNGGFDFMIVDYIRLLSGRSEGHEELNEIVIDLKALAVDYNCVVWSAMQPQRDPTRNLRSYIPTKLNQSDNDKPVLDLTDVAECWAVSFISDYVVSINQTLTERNANPPEYRLFKAKVREPKKGCPTYNTLKGWVDYGRSIFI